MKQFLVPLAAIAMPLSVNAAVYECDRTNMARGGWIPPKIFLEINDAGTEAKALDGYIKDVHDKPIAVDIKNKGNGTYDLSWKLRNVQTTNTGSAILTHRLTLNPAKGTFKMRGRLHGYDNNINGSGTCKKIG